ncbi:hypothetical protein [Jiangella mangrovi]|uniref:Uncharacterized protein n=1 Tax=Jiangella mangrovi TaxID=1524084 RepID=A0A7W9GS23_9ACTN|nr:hypothetical protein [Jiangella mangrovi]MBB5788686.1 hypothetical protein [Jiangella mangrovi]
MPPPASGDARPTSRHAAGGRRAADRGSGNDPGRRSGDSSAPEVTETGDDLGIAAWLESAGPAPHETGPLLPGFGGLIGADAADPLGLDAPQRPAEDEPARRHASKHAAPSGRADLGRPGDRDAGSGAEPAAAPPPATPPPAESRHEAAPGADAPGETRGARRARATGPTPDPGESRHAAGPEPAAESARPEHPSGDEPVRGSRASRHAAGGRRAATRRSGPVPIDDAATAAAAGTPVFGTPFWSGPSQEPDPDDPLGLNEPEAAPAAPSHRASRASGPVTQAWAPPPPPETAVTRRAPVPAPASAPSPAPVASTVAAPPTIHAFAPALAPDPVDEDDDAPEREPSARTGGGTRGRSPSIRPRKTGGDPPQRTTGGTLAACLAVAAVLGFAGGAWFGSRDDGSDPAGDAATSDPGTPGEGEAPPAEGLTLTADPVSVAPNDLIALAGTLAPVDDGVEVTLQHRVGDGEWVDYPASRPLTFTTRADGSFSGSVATDAPGPNYFRVVNIDDAEEVSNEIEVTVAE